MPAHKLILLPADPHATLDDCGKLAAGLQAIGLIGAPGACDGNEFYPTGDDFLQLVSFLGCAPNIELEPPADNATLAAALANGSFCFVRLLCTDILHFRGDPQARAPRCPQCSEPVADWETHLRQWRENPAALQWSCTSCGYHGELPDWSLHKNAGFGQVFVEISGIYPSEAIPGPALLQALQTLTGGHWQYVYIKE